MSRAKQREWATIRYCPRLGRRVTPSLYHRWVKMRERCRISTGHHARFYKERGIAVCQEWHVYANFRAWAISSGFRKGLTLDRIDVNGNYEPANCRWIPQSLQQHNTRRVIQLTLRGVTKPLPVWASELGWMPEVLRSRRSAGWTDEQALTIPLGKHRPGTLTGRAAAKAKRLAAQQLGT